MANPLIPQKRPDKNNRLVTRHVKPISAKAKPAVMPAPAIAQQFRVQPQDVRKPRRAGISKSDAMDAMIIRNALSIAPADVTTGSVDMSDNELYDFMKLGFRITNAVEFKRYGADVEAARYVGVSRNMSAPKSVERMQSLGIAPESAARILRHGISDRMLDGNLSDQELFDLLYKENLNSTKNYQRSTAARYLIDGSVTPEDAAELGMEALGTYGMTLRNRRRDHLPIDYEVIRSAIVKSEEPQAKISDKRRSEGWSGLDQKVTPEQLLKLVDTHGPEVLEIRHLGVFRMGSRFGGAMDGYRYMDRFFALVQQDEFSLDDEQRMEMWKRDPSAGREPSDYVEMLRKDGLTPEQAASSLRNGLTLEKAHQVHLNKLSGAMIEGWL